MPRDQGHAASIWLIGPDSIILPGWVKWHLRRRAPGQGYVVAPAPHRRGIGSSTARAAEAGPNVASPGGAWQAPRGPREGTDGDGRGWAAAR